MYQRRKRTRIMDSVMADKGLSADRPLSEQMANETMAIPWQKKLDIKVGVLVWRAA